MIPDFAKKALPYLVVAVAAACVGRALAPTKVVEHTTVTERVKEDTAARARVVELEQQVAEFKTQTHRVRTIVISPDKTKTLTETTDTATDQAVDTKRDVVTDVSNEAHKQAEIVHETVRIIERKAPDWRVGVDTGARLKDPTLNYGVTVQRRILGPFSVTVHGNTSGEFRAGLNLEF